MKDQRKTNRRFLLYFMRVFDAGSHNHIGNLVDITPQGIMIVSEHPFPVEDTKQLRLELSAEVSEKPYMEFSAISKWCRPDVAPNMYNTGFEILEISSEDAGIIQKIVAEFGFRDNQLVN